jgi:hypothetical protein
MLQCRNAAPKEEGPFYQDTKQSASTPCNIFYHSVYFVDNSPIGSQQMRRMLFAVLVCVGLSGCAISPAVESIFGGCRPYGMKGGSSDPEGGMLRPEPRLPPGCDGPFKRRPKYVPQGYERKAA